MGGLNCRGLWDAWLIYPKLVYLVLGMAAYVSNTYLPNYLEDVWKIPLAGYGFLVVICVLSLWCSVCSCRLAERYDCHRKMLMVSIFFYAFFFLLMRLEALVSESLWVRLTVVMILYGASSIFCSMIFPLIDHLILSQLGQDARLSKDLFGRQRLFTSLGHALIVAINGIGIDRFGYDSMFVSMLMTSLLSLLLVSLQGRDGTDVSDIEKTIDSNLPSKPNLDSSPPKSSLMGPLRTICTRPFFGLFILMVLFAGYSRCVMGNFVSVFFKSVLKMPPSTYGIIMQARLIPELFYFFYGMQLGKSHEVVLWIAYVSSLLRSSIYCMIKEDRGLYTMAIVFIAEASKGISHAGITMAGTRIAHEMAPEGTESTALALFHGAYGAIAMLLSGIASTIFLLHSGNDTSRGLQMLFLSATLIGLIPCVVQAVRLPHFHRPKK